MSPPPASRSSAAVLVSIAWGRYLAAVRQCEHDTYDLIEELAWDHLGDELARVRATAHRRRASEPSERRVRAA